MAKASLGRAAYLLALIGGVIMIIVGLLSFVGMAFMSFMSPIGGMLGMGAGILQIILGVVAIIASKRVTDLIWAIILIVIGLIGGGLGGLLILLGGILGLLAKYI